MINASWAYVAVPVAAIFVSIASVLVAILQWRTARSKLRLDSFEKRFAIWDATRNAVNEARNGSETEAFKVFCRQKEIARLVMPQVHKELDIISSVMGELATARLDKKDYRSEADRLAAIKKEEQNVRQLGIQLEGLTNSFAHHMSIVS